MPFSPLPCLIIHKELYTNLRMYQRGTVRATYSLEEQSSLETTCEKTKNTRCCEEHLLIKEKLQVQVLLLKIGALIANLRFNSASVQESSRFRKKKNINRYEILFFFERNQIVRLKEFDPSR